MTADAVGGVWHYVAELASGLSQHGIETVVAVLGPPSSREQRRLLDRAPGVRVVDTGLALDWMGDKAASARAAATLDEIGRSEAIDVVHLNSPALAAMHRFEVPVLGVAHGCPSTWWEAARPGQPLDPQFAWHHEAMARGLRACDRIVAPSASFADSVRRRYRLPVLPRVVHNGRTPPASVGREPLHDCALTAGRLWDEVKNIKVLDAAAARLPFPFHAAGPVKSPQGAAVGFEHLNLLGALGSDELARRLAERPVFVAAATFEPFGLAVLEAAQNGCALVLSDIPTFRELWDGAAVFVPAENHEAIAAAVEDAVQDLPLRRALGDAAHARAARYGVAPMASAMAGHYSELLARRAAA
jgi:glycosyltransferase involved in cell wall biosynthesis